MPRKIKFAKLEEVKGSVKQRAEIILRNHGGDVSRAMEYCAAVGESRAVLGIINPIKGEEFNEMCVICQNEGPHDLSDRRHVLEGQE